MILGIVVGTYSSIYVSSSLLITLGLRAEPTPSDKPTRGVADNAERVAPRER
jgi:preprotein translocase subunit SecF